MSKITFPDISVCGEPHYVAHTYCETITYSQRDQRSKLLDPRRHTPPQLCLIEHNLYGFT